MQRFRTEVHNVFVENVNKIPLSANDDKWIQKPDGVITCLYEVITCPYPKKESGTHQNKKFSI